IPTACMHAPSRWKSNPVRRWRRDRSKPRPFRSRSNRTTSSSPSDVRVSNRHRRPRRTGGTAVKLEDVARHAGVSTASVSRALNTPNLVSQVLRDRITQAAQDLKWVPNGVAKALASLRTRTVGVMIPTLSHQNFAVLIEALQQDLAVAHYTLILCCMDVAE